MLIRKIVIVIAALTLPLVTLITWATPQNVSVIKGKQYKAITPSPTIPIELNIPKHKVIVMEFFSYGCPWCFRLEPAVEKWKQHKPKSIIFERVPLVFESGWKFYSKAYYAAQALGILDKITPALFNAIHKKGLNLTSEQAMQQFFASQHVNKKTFESVFNFSPGIGAELTRAKNLMLAYRVFNIPTFVINGKYKTNILMANGNTKKLLHIVNTLAKMELKREGKENLKK